MIETITELLLSGLGAALLAAWRGLPLLVIVLLIIQVGKGRIAPRVQCWLWMLVVVRLLLPVSVASPISFAGPMDALIDRLGNACWPKAPPPTVPQIWVLPDGTEVVQPSRPIHSKAEGVVVLPSTLELYPSSSPSRSAFDWQKYAAFSIAWTWAVVAIFLMARFVIATVRFSRSVRSAPAIDNAPLMSELVHACQQMRIARCPRVVQLTSITAPAVFGWWKPVLCFPAQHAFELSPQELNWVLRHELAHVKSRDALLLTIAAFMKAIHWFNPLAWIVETQLKQAIEQAADASVTQDLNTTMVTEYGRVLLRFAAAQCDVVRPRLVGLLSMASTSGLKRRIGALGRNHAQSWMARFSVLSLTAIIAGAGLTDAVAVSVYPHSQSQWSSVRPLTIGPEKQFDQLQRQRVSIDVRGALTKATQLQPGIDAERFVLQYFTGMSSSGISSPAEKPSTIANGILSADLTDFEARTIKQRLRAFERSGPWQISVECRFVEADLKIAEAFSWDATDVKRVVRDANMPLEKAQAGQVDRWNELLIDESLSDTLASANSTEPMRPVLAAKLSDSQIRAFLRACQSDSRGKVLQAPRVTCFSGQIISLASIVQRPFVTNVAIAADHPRGGLEPTIDVIGEGWSAHLSAEATEDGAVDLACILRETNITDVELANLPIRSPAQPESDVIVQVPTVQRVSAGSQMRLEVGESLAIAVPRTFRDHTQRTRPPAMFYVFTPRLISDSEALRHYVAK